MNWDRIEGQWEQFKGQLKTKWGKLTDDDLMVLKGKRDQLSGVIQSRYGLAKDKAEQQIDEWTDSLDTPTERKVERNYRESRP